MHTASRGVALEGSRPLLQVEAGDADRLAHGVRADVLIRNLVLPNVLDATALRSVAQSVRALDSSASSLSSSSHRPPPGALISAEVSAVEVLVLRRDEPPPTRSPASGVVVPFARPPSPPERPDPASLASSYAAVLAALCAAPVPTLAVLEGAIHADEMCLFAACDVVVAAPDTRFLTDGSSPRGSWSWSWAPDSPTLSRRRSQLLASPHVHASSSEADQPCRDLKWARAIGLVDHVLEAPAITASTAVWVRALAHAPPAIRGWLRERSADFDDSEGWALLRSDPHEAARESGVTTTLPAGTSASPPSKRTENTG
jgi:hypothetical protein